MVGQTERIDAESERETHLCFRISVLTHGTVDKFRSRFEHPFENKGVRSWLKREREREREKARERERELERERVS